MNNYNFCEAEVLPRYLNVFNILHKSVFQNFGPARRPALRFLSKKVGISLLFYFNFIDNNFDIPLSSIVIPYTVSAASIVPFLCVITKNCVCFANFFK